MQKMFECRYEERADSFTASVYAASDGATVQSLYGPLSERPEWLVELASVLRVGGHLDQLEAPPPDRVAWVSLDQNLRLTSVDMSTSLRDTNV